MGYWEEEAVSFAGNIRKSGNSYVITIPAELFQRFLLREGQSVKVFGMTRRTPELQGMIGLFLGSFQVTEKQFNLEITIKNASRITEEREESGKTVRSIPIIERAAEKYAATGFYIDIAGDEAKVKIIFGCITPQTIIKPKTKEEVAKIKDYIIDEIRRAGGTVESAKILEEEAEWHMIDPSLIAKSPYKDSIFLRCEWKI